MQNSMPIANENPDDVITDGEFTPFEKWLLDEFHFPDLESGKGAEETCLARAFFHDKGATLAKLPEVVSKAQSLRIKDVGAEVYGTCRGLFDE